MKVVVLSGAGREEQSFRAIEELGLQNPGFPFWVYRSDVRGPREEFWCMLRAAWTQGEDVLALEDDIVTARNFFRYAERWPSPHVTSFFHAGRPTLGEPVSAEGFSFCQAVKFPCSLLVRLFFAKPRQHEGAGQDDDLGFRLQDLGEPVVYHRSLVQHVGAESLSWPGLTLAHRGAMDFPGLDFDCLSIGA